MALFTPNELADHISRPARWWHLARNRIGVGWRTMQASATIEGRVLGGEAASDGDTCFDVHVFPDLRVHCEVDPDDLAFFRGALLALDIGQTVRVTGPCVCDLGHGTLELHPITALGDVSK